MLDLMMCPLKYFFPTLSLFNNTINNIPMETKIDNDSPSVDCSEGPNFIYSFIDSAIDCGDEDSYTGHNEIIVDVHEGFKKNVTFLPPHPPPVGLSKDRKEPTLMSCMLDKSKRTLPKPHRVQLAEILVTVFILEDSLEHIESRSKYWEFQACSRDRFGNRIRRVEDQIAHVFTPEHREKIFNQRFKDHYLFEESPEELKEFDILEKLKFD
ncbi:protein phosphatase 1 regulatory subunit 15 [Brevipalpus obovatus]|uniref:protein phosphatase 1 regulatory subunit 15 n=1 Tax=Brevipalpus obovatus TaxID=246614 RepID=UPI003D9E3765